MERTTSRARAGFGSPTHLPGRSLAVSFSPGWGWKWSCRTSTTTLTDLIDAIRSDEFASKISRLRSTLASGDDDGYAVAKKDLQAVSISGTAEGKRAKAIEALKVQEALNSI